MKDINIKIAIAGNVDSGKTTFSGLLVNNCLDDGRGYCRSLVLKMPHEKESGRTSTVTNNNYIVNKDDYRKIFSLIDLAGHEKYFKTTLFGMTSSFLDYGLLMIGANMGITKMTKEHLGILLYLNVPIIICLTKIDLCPENVYKSNINRLRKIFKLPILKKKPWFFTKDNCEKEMKKFLDLDNPLDSFIPIIPISNKSGKNINDIKSLISNLNPTFEFKNDISGTIMYIDSKFLVNGIGIVVCGTVRGDKILINQKLWIGPFNGEFISVKVRSIHNNIRESILELEDNNYGCLAIKSLGKKNLIKSQIKRGCVIIDNLELSKNVKRKFLAEITVLNHSTTITNTYSPVIHCGSITQSAELRIIEIKDGITQCKKNLIKLRTGCKAIVEFTFKYRPEYIEKDFDLFFRDGKTKGFGKVI